MQLNIKKQPNQEMGRRPKQIFLQRHTDGQHTHVKMLNIANHQGNANQSHNEIHLTPVRMAIIKMNRNNKCWQGCRWRKGNPHTLLVGL